MKRTDTADGAGSLQVLLVEDHQMLAQGLTRYLRAFGHHVTVAEDLCTARAALRNGRYDLLLTDIQLPDGEGSELLDGHLPLPEFVATMSGFELPEMAPVVDGSVRHHLIKPFRIEEFDLIIEACVRRMSARESVVEESVDRLVAV